MTRARSPLAFLLVIAAVTEASADWSYKTTQDGQYKLGRNGSNLSVEVRTMTVSFRVPSDWHVYACTDEPMNSIYSAGTPASAFGLDFTVEENPHKQSVAEQYRSYLKFIRGSADDKVQMRPEAPFRLPDKRQLTPYRYFSDYWGQRLVVLIPEREYTCRFEFSAHSSLAALRASHSAIHRILQSYRCIPKESSNQAMQRTAGRVAFSLAMTSTPNPQPRASLPAVADLVSR
jgi:hypothetical protein